MKEGTETYVAGEYEFEIDWEQDRRVKEQALFTHDIMFPRQCDTHKLMEWMKREFVKVMTLIYMGWEIKYTFGAHTIKWKISFADLRNS